MPTDGQGRSAKKSASGRRTDLGGGNRDTADVNCARQEENAPAKDIVFRQLKNRRDMEETNRTGKVVWGFSLCLSICGGQNRLCAFLAADGKRRKKRTAHKWIAKGRTSEKSERGWRRSCGERVRRRAMGGPYCSSPRIRTAAAMTTISSEATRHAGGKRKREV